MHAKAMSLSLALVWCSIQMIKNSSTVLILISSSKSQAWNTRLPAISTRPFHNQIKISASLEAIPLSITNRTSKYGSDLKSDHNTTVAKSKSICKNYTDRIVMKENWINKTHNSSYLLLSRKRKWLKNVLKKILNMTFLIRNKRLPLLNATF